MKKGTLNKIGKGWQIVSAEGKSISVMGDFKLTDDMAGKEIEFDNTGGPVQKIVLAGKTYLKAQTAPVKSQSHPNQNYNQRNQPSRPNPSSRTNVTPQNTTPRRDETREMAPSPYNFISLNQTVVPSNAQENDFSVYDGLSGYIDVTVTTQTPMFIRGVKEDFFKIGGDMAIPGSSFRGLIRTMVEMMSYSKLNSIDATKSLFMRFVAASQHATYRNYYYDRMGMAKQRNQTVLYKAKAGFLNFDSNNKQYYIISTQCTDARKTPYLDKSDDDFKIVNQTTHNQYWVYSGYMESKDRDRNIIRKKQFYKFNYPIDENKIIVSQNVINDYKEDKNRQLPSHFNILEKCREIDFPHGFPIFYSTDENGQVSSFGHTKYYRLPYLKRVGELRSESHLEQKFDFAESIFGVIDEKNQVERAGKVYFEDLKSPQGQTYPPKKTQILGSPKPTSFQLYLEQPHGVETHKEDLAHWDTPDAKIRGNKNYWHRVTSNDTNQPYSWVQSNAQNTNDRDNSIRNQDPIKAVKERSVFTGRIRFDNLSQKELGALLCALNLPDGCCHKIGMGKPLGLGSIRVEAELSLINRKERYKNLFDMNGNWNEAKNKEEEGSYKNDFTNHIFKEVGQEDKNNATSFWDLPRMKELKKMLTFDTQLQADEAWLKSTRYQKIQPTNEFKQRPVLPKPEEVK